MSVCDVWLEILGVCPPCEYAPEVRLSYELCLFLMDLSINVMHCEMFFGNNVLCSAVSCIVAQL